MVEMQLPDWVDEAPTDQELERRYANNSGEQRTQDYEHQQEGDEKKCHEQSTGRERGNPQSALVMIHAEGSRMEQYFIGPFEASADAWAWHEYVYPNDNEPVYVVSLERPQ